MAMEYSKRKLQEQNENSLDNIDESDERFLRSSEIVKELLKDLILRISSESNIYCQSINEELATDSIITRERENFAKEFCERLKTIHQDDDKTSFIPLCDIKIPVCDDAVTSFGRIIPDSEPANVDNGDKEDIKIEACDDEIVLQDDNRTNLIHLSDIKIEVCDDADTTFSGITPGSEPANMGNDDEEDIKIKVRDDANTTFDGNTPGSEPANVDKGDEEDIKIEVCDDADTILGGITLGSEPDDVDNGDEEDINIEACNDADTTFGGITPGSEPTNVDNDDEEDIKIEVCDDADIAFGGITPGSEPANVDNDDDEVQILYHSYHGYAYLKDVPFPLLNPNNVITFDDEEPMFNVSYELAIERNRRRYLTQIAQGEDIENCQTIEDRKRELANKTVEQKLLEAKKKDRRNRTYAFFICRITVKILRQLVAEVPNQGIIAKYLLKFQSITVTPGSLIYVPTFIHVVSFIRGCKDFITFVRVLADKCYYICHAMFPIPAGCNFETVFMSEVRKFAPTPCADVEFDYGDLSDTNSDIYDYDELF